MPRDARRGKASRRSLAKELLAWVEAMRQHREGKLTLRTCRVDPVDLPPVDAAVIRQTREKLCMSQSVFARRLHVNPRTMQRWEEGRSRPNEQAAALILLVKAFPDTIERLAELGRHNRPERGQRG